MSSNVHSENGNNQQSEDVLLITDVPESPEIQFRRRRRQYLVMMGLRLVCLLAGVIVVSVHVPGALWWAGLCIAGMVLLPWVAVLVANDGPPRKRVRRRRLEPSTTTKTLPPGSVST